MTTSLVQLITDNRLRTTSRVVAKHFGKRHDNVLRDIRALECPPEFHLLNFEEREFKDHRGQMYPEFEMTRDGFTILSMGFTGGKAMEWKLKFLAAFNAMEQSLIDQHGRISWNEGRKTGKTIRLALADTIADFVKYATAQGSTKAEKYYTSITRMEYKALDLLEQQKQSVLEKVPFRDTLSVMDICDLTAAERFARGAIQKGMDEGLPYKDIYLLAKERVTMHAALVSLTKLGTST